MPREILLDKTDSNSWLVIDFTFVLLHYKMEIIPDNHYGIACDVLIILQEPYKN